MKIPIKVLLQNGEIFNIIKTINEPISNNVVYIINGTYVGPNDMKNGYARDYYGKDTSFIYPSEIEEFIYE